MVNRTELTRIAREEFADIVIDVYQIDAKLRVLLCDESSLDFWWSEVQEGRFAHHWNRQNVDGTMYRHDNAPYKRWAHIATFPSALSSGTGKDGDGKFSASGTSRGAKNVSRIGREMIQTGKTRH